MHRTSSNANAEWSEIIYAKAGLFSFLQGVCHNTPGLWLVFFFSLRKFAKAKSLGTEVYEKCMS